jgi:hypothetical protein
MSHSVKIQTRFKSLDTLRKAFEQFGWTLKENSKAKTYPSDPARDTIYPFVAVNPQQGYDLGLKIKEDGEVEVFGDFYDRSLSEQLGRNLDKLKQTYSKQLIEDTYVQQGYSVSYETLKNGAVKATISR